MIAFLKNIFQRKPVAAGPEFETLETEDAAAGAAPASTPAPALSEPRPASRPMVRETGGGSSVEVSLQSVFAAFPPELKSRIKQLDVGNGSVSVSLEKVLAQLPMGTVKITFGELRRAAPQLFSAGSDSDSVSVPLPLGEILAQVDPTLLARRRSQKRIEVPEEIRSPFGDHGNGLIFSVGPGQPPQAAAPAARSVTPAGQNSFAAAPPRTAPPAPLPPVKPQPPQFAAPGPGLLRGSFAPMPTPLPPTAKPAGPPPASAVPPALHGVGAFSQPASPLAFGRPQSPITPRGPAQPVPPVRAAVNPPAVPAPQPAPVKSPPAVPMMSAPAIPMTSAAAPAADAPEFGVPLAGVAEGWPEALRHEIAQMNLGGAARLGLPADLLQQALKRGKVAFPWKQLRSWIRPSPQMAVSVHDNTLLELPLKLIAPLFLNRQKEGERVQQKVQLDETIPNLFFGFPQPGTPAAATGAPSAAHPVSRPVDTNYYVWEETPEVAPREEIPARPSQEPSPGTNFVTRYATPNEVVSRAAALDAVAGALIALPDGLMVASRLSSDLNGDTLAAFLPQIFSKVSQCTKELRMGDLNNLNFTVGNVPWKIFRVNAIFFAAFGHPGQPLPTGQLAALAAELDRKKQ